MAVASVTPDGRAYVLDDGFAASRKSDGGWVPGLIFPVYVTSEEFSAVGDDEAVTLSKAARMEVSS